MPESTAGGSVSLGWGFRLGLETWNLKPPDPRPIFTTVARGEMIFCYLPQRPCGMN